MKYNALKSTGLAMFLTMFLCSCGDNGTDSGEINAVRKDHGKITPLPEEVLFKELKTLVEYSRAPEDTKPYVAKRGYEFRVDKYLLKETLKFNECTLVSEKIWRGALSHKPVNLATPTSKQTIVSFAWKMNLDEVDADKTDALRSSKLILVRGAVFDHLSTYYKEGGWQKSEDLELIPVFDRKAWHPKYSGQIVKSSQNRSGDFELGVAYPEDQKEIQEAFDKLVRRCQRPEVIAKRIADEQVRIEAEESQRLESAAFMVDLFDQACLQQKDNIQARFRALQENNQIESVDPNPRFGPGSLSLRAIHLGATFSISYRGKDNNCTISVKKKPPVQTPWFDGQQLEKALSRLIKATTDENTEKYSMTFDEGNGLVTVDHTTTLNQYVAHNDVEFELIYGSQPDYPTIIGTKNDHSVADLNAGQEGLVRDYLKAYDNDLKTIELVADNADYAVLAWAAYGDTDALSLAKARGWSPLRPIKKKNYFTGGDAIATLFSSDKGKTVLAFRGTKTLGDWVTDIKGTPSFKSLDNKQIEGARAIAREIAAQHDDVVFVGHSLGGRMAQVARLATDKAAVTFNTAPLGVNDRLKALGSGSEPKASLTSFKSPEDPLSSLFSPSDVEVSNIASVEGGALTVVVNADYTHSMKVIAQAMQAVRLARDGGWISAYLSKGH